MKRNPFNNTEFIKVTINSTRARCKYWHATHVRISFNMTGKMEYVLSLSTSCLDNPFCQARMKIKGSICEKCFAEAILNARENVHDNCAGNFKVLTSRILTTIPDIDAYKMNESNPYRIFRFESFGDLYNEIQFVNYWNIARFNPNTKFALWTKNPAIVYRAFKQYDLYKLSNMTLVMSSLYIGEKAVDKYGLFDHVFTVYASENDACINCGARDCKTCTACYRRDSEYHISELLK